MAPLTSRSLRPIKSSGASPNRAAWLRLEKRKHPRPPQLPDEDRTRHGVGKQLQIFDRMGVAAQPAEQNPGDRQAGEARKEPRQRNADQNRAYKTRTGLPGRKAGRGQTNDQTDRYPVHISARIRIYAIMYLWSRITLLVKYITTPSDASRYH